VRRLAVIGGGAWGTALAIVACRAGTIPVLWARDADVVSNINERHENPIFLPDVGLDPEITATTDLDAAMVGAEAALLAVPAQFLRAVIERLGPYLRPGIPILHCAKGIETRSLKTMSEVAREIIPCTPSAVLSGPTFAAEVARDLPTAVTIASRDASLGRSFMAALGSGRFRPYLSDDPIGAEIGGAVKNVLAIACGVVCGRGLGDNARAALITRGLAEITRLGVALGAQPLTFSGLAGLGDLVLTCTGSLSRNRALGFEIARGRSLAEVEGATRMVAEGVRTVPSAVGLADKAGVPMPICREVAEVLFSGKPVAEALDALLARDPRPEEEWPRRV